MLYSNTLSQIKYHLIHLTFKRYRVRILPKKPNEMEQVKPGKSWLTDWFSWLHRKKITWQDIKEVLDKKEMSMIREDQKYLPLRHQTLGSDLATAHFLLFRGGQVRFKDHTKWSTSAHLKKMQIPAQFNPDFIVEEIDASGMNLCYEGFENLCNLYSLKKLYLKNCPLIDDWCLNRMHLFETSLEFLDISGCHKVTEAGICTLHKLKKLKTLIIKDTPNIKDKELVSLLLQDIIPECEIIGVDYNDPVLLKKIEDFCDDKNAEVKTLC